MDRDRRGWTIAILLFVAISCDVGAHQLIDQNPNLTWRGIFSIAAVVVLFLASFISVVSATVVAAKWLQKVPFWDRVGASIVIRVVRDGKQIKKSVSF
jgi:hypothetical protein